MVMRSSLLIKLQVEVESIPWVRNCPMALRTTVATTGAGAGVQFHAKPYNTILYHDVPLQHHQFINPASFNSKEDCDVFHSVFPQTSCILLPQSYPVSTVAGMLSIASTEKPQIFVTQRIRHQKNPSLGWLLTLENKSQSMWKELSS